MFYKWLTDNGANTHDAVEIAKFEGMGYGLRAKRDLKVTLPSTTLHLISLSPFPKGYRGKEGGRDAAREERGGGRKRKREEERRMRRFIYFEFSRKVNCSWRCRARI
jgi:hypothetical protein